MSKGITVYTLPVGSFVANCYLLVDCKTNKTLIIDPGDDADYIERIISDKKLEPQLVVATHGHFDHIMAATELVLAYNISFAMHLDDQFLAGRLVASVKHFLQINSDPPPKVGKKLSDGDKLKFGKSILTIISIPGHTPGSIALYNKTNKIVFTGDLIFAEGGIGRTDFSYSNKEELDKSIQNILTLPKETVIYPGHGKNTTVEKELQYFVKKD